MSAIVQFDLFKSKEDSELDSLRKYCEEIHESTHKVRKGIFAKHGELNKKYIDLEERLQIIEKNLCKS